MMMMMMENEALCPHIDNEKEKQRAIMRKKRVIQKEEGTGGCGEGGVPVIMACVSVHGVSYT